MGDALRGLVVFIPTVLLAIGATVFAASWIVGLSDRPMDSSQSTHLIAFILGIFSVAGLIVIEVRTTLVGVVLLHAAVVMLMVTMGFFAASIGVNQYYAEFCAHDDDILQEHANSTEVAQCYDAAIGVQYASAVGVIAMIIVSIVRLQHIGRTLASYATQSHAMQELSTNTHFSQHTQAME
eukprot:TRINITY_DN28050_c0_g1_i1.p2 TRINITY_DN28050_c0_g1~~TRINITY_DN28050_c0_g1_i1.p2  ORF type:complete len:195 (+),score=51.80 TRINITY_DN28050_c0_g1_i1:45-587(+)